MLVVLGLVMDFTKENQQLYSVAFLFSIPLMGVLFMLKTSFVAYFAIYKRQRWLLLVRCAVLVCYLHGADRLQCTCGQVMQLVFVWWTRTLADVEQANVLCLVTLVLIILDVSIPVVSYSSLTFTYAP